MIEPKREFMLAAIEEAKKAREENDYQIGAVIVKDDKILSKGMNGVRRYQDPTCHAEIEAIRQATHFEKNRHLSGAVLYTTHEPYPMCVTAAIYAKLEGIIYGAEMEDMKNYAINNGNDKWVWRVVDVKSREIAEKGNPKIEIIGPFMREECLKLFHSK